MTDSIDLPTIPDQAAISVYKNAAGIVVVKQAGQYGPDEDEEIHVDPIFALKLAKAILREARIEVAILPWKDVLIVKSGGEVLRPFPPSDEDFWLTISEENGRRGAFVKKQGSRARPANNGKKAP